MATLALALPAFYLFKILLKVNRPHCQGELAEIYAAFDKEEQRNHHNGPDDDGALFS